MFDQHNRKLSRQAKVAKGCVSLPPSEDETTIRVYPQFRFLHSRLFAVSIAQVRLVTV